MSLISLAGRCRDGFLELGDHPHDLVHGDPAGRYWRSSAPLAGVDPQALGLLGAEAHVDQRGHRHLHGLPALQTDPPDQTLGDDQEGDEEIRKGGMPMSSSRVTVLGRRSCGVENTRCPVSAARIAICAVSRSSRRRIHVGILPQERPQGRGEVVSDVLADEDLVDPGDVELDGSSAVMMLMSGLLMVAIAA